MERWGRNKLVKSVMSCSELTMPWQTPTPHLISSRRGEMCAVAGNMRSDQLKLAGSADRLAAAGGRQLAVDVFEVRPVVSGQGR